MRLWLAIGQAGKVVGGVAAFRCPDRASPAARLQEVDIFPAHRGQGLGTALLEGVRDLLLSEGVSSLVIGADEDDWPLGWYRSLGFRDLLRVNKRISQPPARTRLPVAEAAPYRAVRALLVR